MQSLLGGWQRLRMKKRKSNAGRAIPSIASPFLFFFLPPVNFFTLVSTHFPMNPATLFHTNATATVSSAPLAAIASTESPLHSRTK